MYRLKNFCALLALALGMNAQSYAQGMFMANHAKANWPEGGSITIKNCLDIELTVNVLWDNFSISRHTFSVNPDSDYVWDGKRGDQNSSKALGHLLWKSPRIKTLSTCRCPNALATLSC